MGVELSVEEEYAAGFKSGSSNCLLYILTDVYEVGICALSATLQRDFSRGGHHSNASQAIVFALDKTGKGHGLLFFSRLVSV